MSHKYLASAAATTGNPPQSSPLNARQVKNSAGGFVFAVNDWTRLDRFLILGAEGGTYYATEKNLTLDNIDAIKRVVAEDGVRAVKRIVEISDSGRAPKNDPALLALAYAASKGDDRTRAAALDALPEVARIGTHLFHFVDYVKKFRGFGRGLRNAIGAWYQNKPADRLAEQVVKYQQRDGWSHRDLLRLSHPTFSGPHNAIAQWAVKGEGKLGETPELILGHTLLQAATEAKEAARLIRSYGLVRESVPTELLKSPEVWEALLEKMPMTALIRNLGNMSKNGLLKPLSSAAKEVANRLTNKELLKKARVHPIQVLIASKTYEAGHGLRGHGEWTPVPQVVDALDEAFYNAFASVVPTGKNFYIGLDISGSMWSGEIAGVPGLVPAIGAGAMAMTTIKTEANYYVAGFTATDSGRYGGRWDSGGTAMTPISLSPKMRLDSVLKETNALQNRMGGTDCALPMLDAAKQGLKVDTFLVITDNETWAGQTHPMVALQAYRNKFNPNAKLVVMGMTATEFTIADPLDAGTLDVVGFDGATPQLVADFSRD